MAWALSFLLLIGLSAGGFYWHIMHDRSAILQESVLDNADDAGQAEAWTNTSVFEEMSTLEEPQAERLRLLLLESARKGALNQQ